MPEPVPTPDAVNTVPTANVPAVPVPTPTPVAVKVVPTLLFAAPISVKFVVPADIIVYTVPIINEPDVTEAPAPISVKFVVPAHIIVYTVPIANAPAVIPGALFGSRLVRPFPS